MQELKFLKPVDQIVDMFNGQLRVIFIDGTDIVVSTGKRGVVLPRRKRAYARSIGAIR
jgi:hypothetical protein